MWGVGAQQLQCKPESVQCSEKQQSPCEGGGGGGGLKLEKINAGITIKSTKSSPHLRKNWA